RGEGYCQSKSRRLHQKLPTGRSPSTDGLAQSFQFFTISIKPEATRTWPTFYPEARKPEPLQVIHSKAARSFDEGQGTEPIRTTFRSPWQNGVAERWVGSCRRDLPDHVIVLNERHLKRLMREYV